MKKGHISPYTPIFWIKVAFLMENGQTKTFCGQTADVLVKITQLNHYDAFVDLQIRVLDSKALQKGTMLK